MKNITSKLEMIKEKVIAMKEKSPILLGVILLVFSFLTTRGLHLIYDLTGVLDSDSHLELMIREFIYVGIVMLTLWATGQKHIFSRKIKGFFGSLWSGTVVLLATALTIIVDHLAATGEGMTRRSVPEIIIFGVFLLAVGFAEEVLFRGIILGSINKKYGSTGIGALLSLVSSSIIFGCAHISNVFAGQSLDETIVQVICTMFIGFVFGVIYLKRGNIFAVALIHAVYDLAAMYLSGIYDAGSIISDVTPGGELPGLSEIIIDNIFYLALGLILFIPCMIKLRKERKMQMTMAAAA